MMPIFSGTRIVFPSAVVASMVFVTTVHGLKMGWPSRALSTLANTSGKCRPAQRSVRPPSTFIGVPVACERKPNP